MASDDLGNHLALRRGLVRQHGFANEVTNRPDIAHGCPALVINLDEAAIHVHGHGLKPPTLRMGLASDGDENLVRRDGKRLSFGRFNGKGRPALSGLSSLGLCAQVQGYTIAIEPAPHRCDQLGIIKWQDLRLGFHDRHLRAQLRKRDTKLKPDIARPDHRKARRQDIKRQRLGRRDDLPAKFEEWQFRWNRAIGQDHVLCPDRGLANPAGLRIREHGKPVDHPHLGPLEQTADTRVQLRYDAFLPLHGLAEVQAWRCRQTDAMDGFLHRMAHRLELAGSMNDGFRRDAAADKACATKAIPLNQRRVEPELSRPDGSHIAAGPATNHKNLGLDRFSHA